MSKKAGSKEKAKDPKKKNTSLRLDGKMLKALKILAIQNETSVQQILEGLIKDHLASNGIVVETEKISSEETNDKEKN